MRRFLCAGLMAFSCLCRLSAADPDARLLAGTWDYDPTRSTALSAWDSLQLVISVDGPRVTFTRRYAAGRRTFDEVVTLDPTKTTNIVPVEYWPDNRHLGVYIGGEKIKKYRLRLHDDGRMLRASADFVVATQQGERPINILSEYKVSASGQLLTLVELRSTRNEPIVYYFKRGTGADAAAKSKTN